MVKRCWCIPRNSSHGVSHPLYFNLTSKYISSFKAIHCVRVYMGACGTISMHMDKVSPMYTQDNPAGCWTSWGRSFSFSHTNENLPDLPNRTEQIQVPDVHHTIVRYCGPHVQHDRWRSINLVVRSLASSNTRVRSLSHRHTQQWVSPFYSFWL